MSNSGLKKNRDITSQSFQRLLNWLDEGKESNGQSYLEMQRRLSAYFDRKNCLTPDDLTDETLNRIARRLDEEGSIDTDTPAKYCYITARFVFLEYLRRKDVASVPLEDALKTHIDNGQTEEQRARHEKMLECLEKCTGGLKPENRELITGYYIGKERAKIENRRNLAQRLGITVNALSIRACRIRDKLEDCVKKCAATA